MTHSIATILLALGITLAAGCAGAPGVSRLRPVDLSGDLDAAALARYRAEADRAIEAGQAGHMLVLEHTNWWPLGILAYWRAGSVKAMHGQDGAWSYMVSSSRGYGPLAVLWASRREASYSSDGKKLSGMGAQSVLWGHLAMFHQMDSPDEAGRLQQHRTAHLLHHFLNWGTMHGEASMSLFSAPNPVGTGQ